MEALRPDGYGEGARPALGRLAVSHLIASARAGASFVARAIFRYPLAPMALDKSQKTRPSARSFAPSFALVPARAIVLALPLALGVLACDLLKKSEPDAGPGATASAPPALPAPPAVAPAAPGPGAPTALAPLAPANAAPAPGGHLHTVKLADGGTSVVNEAGAPAAVPPGFPTALPPGFPTALPSGFPTALPPGFPTAMPSGFPTAFPGFPAPDAGK